MPKPESNQFATELATGSRNELLEERINLSNQNLSIELFTKEKFSESTYCDLYEVSPPPSFRIAHIVTNKLN